MRKFFSALVLIPVGVIFLVFAVANRRLVTVSFDPFNAADPSIGVTLPLFVVLIVVAILGVVAGSAATWFRQRHWRRAARQHEAEAAEARTRLAELQATTAPRGAVEPALLPYFGGPEAARRDKHGATL
ncbi:MAG: LapA family protein [Xanthobacteraceae bacterium]|nr:LapA family protein [Xanthobacteraceae bacterium]